MFWNHTKCRRRSEIIIEVLDGMGVRFLKLSGNFKRNDQCSSSPWDLYPGFGNSPKRTCDFTLLGTGDPISDFRNWTVHFKKCKPESENKTLSWRKMRTYERLYDLKNDEDLKQSLLRHNRLVHNIVDPFLCSGLIPTLHYVIMFQVWNLGLFVYKIKRLNRRTLLNTC